MTIAGRGVHQLLREPESYILALFVPIFLFGMQVGTLEDVAESAFGIGDYAAFQLPVAMMIAATWSAAGQAVVMDIANGYWDKLCVTPVRRSALVIGRLVSELVGVLGYGVALLLFGWVIGVRFPGNPLVGSVTLLVLMLLFAAGYDAIHIAIAMASGSVSAVQTATFVSFPLIFLSPWSVPRSLMTGWFKTAVSFNPLTYILEASRSLLLGEDTVLILRGMVAALLFCGAGIALATLAFHRKMHRA
jgi:ABC-2 type transport system permease protein